MVAGNDDGCIQSRAREAVHEYGISSSGAAGVWCVVDVWARIAIEGSAWLCRSAEWAKGSAGRRVVVEQRVFADGIPRCSIARERRSDSKSAKPGRNHAGAGKGVLQYGRSAEP